MNNRKIGSLRLFWELSKIPVSKISLLKVACIPAPEEFSFGWTWCPSETKRASVLFREGRQGSPPLTEAVERWSKNVRGDSKFRRLNFQLV
jgi:hypothetical protein